MIDEKVKKYSQELERLGIEHKVLEHPQLISIEAVQKYLGYGMDDAGSTLILKTADRFIGIMRRGDTKIDSEKVKNFLGVSEIRMATDEEFEEVTKSPIGAGPVYMSGVTLYIDKKIFEKEYINAGSGSLLYTVKYKTRDLEKIPGSTIVDFTGNEENIGAKKDFFPKFNETVEALRNKNISHQLIKHP